MPTPPPRSEWPGDLTLYLRLLREARPYGRLVALLLAVALLSAPVALLVPVPLKVAVDSVIGSRPLAGPLAALLPPSARAGEGLLVAMALLLIAVALLSRLREMAEQLLRTWIGERMVLDFRARLLAHVQRLSFAHHDASGSSDSVYRVQYDAPSIQEIVIDGGIPFLSSVVSLATMLWVSIRLDWTLACVALAITPLLLLLLKTFRRRLRSRARGVKCLETTALAVVQEVLAGLRVVRAFGQEERENRRFIARSSEGVRARVALSAVENAFGVLVGLTTAAGTAAVLAVGAIHVQSGRITLGTLLLMMGYLGQLYEPLKTISRKVGSLQSHLSGAERAFAILDTSPDVVDRPDARPLERAAGAVTFRRVTFAHPGGPAVLRDVSFSVGAGMRVAIVGATGAGKTTLVSLVARFFDPTDGAILLDGVDLRDWKLADLRRQVAMVLQEPVLFSTSIAENIAYARPNATRDEVVAAATSAHAHDFIQRLPDGYETRVGERGARLSGGERQRIALARACLRDAPILILDEPTSAVDLATEATILDGLERTIQGRTVFVITHRPTAVVRCDLRLHVENGRLVEATPLARQDRIAVGSRAGGGG